MGHSLDDYAMDAMYDAMAEEEADNLQTELIAKHAEAVADALVDAKGLSATRSKIELLNGLSRMSGHEIRIHEDSGGTELNEECGRLLPRTDDPYWGDRTKPRYLLVNMSRMAKDNLVAVIHGSRDQIVGFQLITRGAAYLVRHGEGSMELLVDVLRDRRPDETTNLHYLQATGEDVSHLNTEPWRWESRPVWNEPYMAAVSGTDGRRRNAARYQALTPAKAGALTKAVMAKDGGACLRGLMAADRSLLIYGLLAESGVDNKAVARTLYGDIEAERVWERKVDKIVEIHASANVSSADRAKDYITESICRFTWALLSNHVDHLVNIDRPRPRLVQATEVKVNTTHPALEALRQVKAEAEKYEAMREALARQVRQFEAPLQSLQKGFVGRLPSRPTPSTTSEGEAEAEQKAADEVSELQGEARRGS
jgi:hypothetical protein